MSGIYDLTGKNIENTYQRVVQTPDGVNFYDGTGSLLPLSSSFLSTASAIGNTITFTKGDGSTFPVTVAAGTGAPGGPNTSVQFNGNGVFSGSSAFTFNSASNALTLTGSFNVSGSTTQVGNNNLLGNTLLSGSITISGSTISPTVQIYGNTTHNGYIRFDPVNTNIDSTISASYIYVSGSTNDLYFTQNGQGYANTTRLRWLEGNLYTGLLNGGLITATVGGTTFNISSGSGIIVNLNASINDNPYPTVRYINWGNFINQSITYRTSSVQTFLGIDSNGQIIQQTIPWNDGQYNTSISLGTVIHQNQSTVNASITYPNVAYGWKQRSYDFVKAFGPLKISGYTLYTSSSLGLTVGNGNAFADGRNYQTDPNNPSYITDPGTTVSKIFRYYQSGSSFVQDTNAAAGYPGIDTTQYNPNGSGSLSPTSTGKYYAQRVFWYPNSATKGIVVYYGLGEYNSLDLAQRDYMSEPFLETPNTQQNAIFLGTILIRGNGNFSTPSDYRILQAGLFRSVIPGGGGGGASTLATLSDVSLSTLTYGDLLSYNASTGLWNNTHTLSGSYTLSGSLVTNNGVNVQSLTASFVSASSITGSLFGTSSWAINAVTASFLPAGTYQITSSWAVNALTASTSIISLAGDNNNYSVLFATSSLSPSPLNFNSGRLYFNPSTGTLTTTTYANTSAGTINPITSSWATNALTASFTVSSSFATTASFVISASFASTSSTSTTAVSSSFSSTIRIDTNADFYPTFVDSNNSVTQYEQLYTDRSNALKFNPSTGILTTTTLNATNITASLFGTASWAQNVTSASFASTASTINTEDTSVSKVYYLTFVDSNNTPASAETIYTNQFVTYDPGTKTITSTFAGNLTGTASLASTASYTPNALVTASVSSNILTFTKGNGSTFNLTVDTGSGGGGTPGGADTSIQFKSGSTFGGNNNLTYQYDTTAVSSNQLLHKYSEDFRSNPFTTDFKGSYLPANNLNTYRQLVGISNFQYSLAANTAATTIYIFDANGGTPGNLNMHGFKCDYSLLLFDGFNKIASRVGTLIGAWSYDENIAPVIQDNYVDGDQVNNELGTIVFTLDWIGGEINLQMDCSSVNSATYFNGLFTNFGNTL